MAMPSQKTTWIGLVIAALTFATAYLGVDKYQASQGETTVETTVEAADIMVNVTGIPSMPPHTHPPDRSDQDIQAMIDQAVDAEMKEHTTGGRFH